MFMSLMGMEVAHLVIADVGTGTGAIALNLAIHLPAARIYATDSSEKALIVANYNIRRHNVADRVTLCHGDLLESLPEPVDLIVGPTCLIFPPPAYPRFSPKSNGNRWLLWTAENRAWTKSPVSSPRRRKG